MKLYRELWAESQLQEPKDVYFAHKDEIDDDFTIPDERASFIIKTIMAGIAPRIFTHQDKVIKGHEILAALKRCFEYSLVFTGKLCEEINGKVYIDIPVLYRALLEDHFVEVVEIGYDSNPGDIEYLFENIN